MDHRATEPEEFVELLDRLITERLKLHLLQSSPNIDHTVDNRSVVRGFETRIAAVKARLAQVLRG